VSHDGEVMRTLALASLLFMTEALAAPGALWLQPGKSVTIFDAARSRAAA